uniref:Uncharacterized protein n=1 Tax=Oryza nivara TaxID=4536 RepID=A0A0E0I0R0_ORYNI
MATNNGGEEMKVESGVVGEVGGEEEGGGAEEEEEVRQVPGRRVAKQRWRLPAVDPATWIPTTATDGGARRGKPRSRAAVLRHRLAIPAPSLPRNGAAVLTRSRSPVVRDRLGFRSCIPSQRFVLAPAHSFRGLGIFL